MRVGWARVGYMLGSFSFSEFEFDLRCEASVSQFLNRGTDREGTELPAESSNHPLDTWLQPRLKVGLWSLSKLRLYFLPLRITSLRVREVKQRLFKGMNLCRPAMDALRQVEPSSPILLCSVIYKLHTDISRRRGAKLVRSQTAYGMRNERREWAALG